MLLKALEIVERDHLRHQQRLPDDIESARAIVQTEVPITGVSDMGRAPEILGLATDQLGNGDDLHVAHDRGAVAQQDFVSNRGTNCGVKAPAMVAEGDDVLLREVQASSERQAERRKHTGFPVNFGKGTPEAARNIFAAGSANKDGLLWKKLAVVSWIVVVFGAAYSTYFFFSMPAFSVSQQPTPVQKVEQLVQSGPPLQEKITKPEVLPKEIIVPDQRDSRRQDAVVAEDVQVPTKLEPSAPVVEQKLATLPKSASLEKGPDQAVVEAKLPKLLPEEEAFIRVEQKLATLPKSVPLEKGPSQVVIETKLPKLLPEEEVSIRPVVETHVAEPVGVESVHKQLVVAREAFFLGNTQKAKTNYEEVLRADEHSRDALLGMAAAAVREGRLVDADGFYLRLLGENPQDSLALAGLASIRADVDPVQRESGIKSILQREPDAHHLYFALGSIYAAQKRWSEAQQAFFRALVGDGSNADYAFNLAVSLDHLGQSAVAVDYYRKSLVFHALRPGGFAIGDVEKRVHSLNKRLEGESAAKFRSQREPF
ncbi:MAG: tetratricopeptide repeat protein [Magnetococcus sp. XQGC-1]